mmetsp:Transcript_4336/g.3591  ORF Transcript_4336/g.3591 Transcript_4336/m.3591 type:complete len:83 (-) Transcript_4336:25-273(-)
MNESGMEEMVIVCSTTQLSFTNSINTVIHISSKTQEEQMAVVAKVCVEDCCHTSTAAQEMPTAARLVPEMHRAVVDCSSTLA